MSKFITVEEQNLPEGTVFREHLLTKTYHFSWQIRFSLELDPKTVNNTTMFVTSPSGSIINCKITYDEFTNIIEIKPLERYEPKATYTLTITTRVKSIKGSTLKQDVQFPFSID